MSAGNSCVYDSSTFECKVDMIDYANVEEIKGAQESLPIKIRLP